MKNSRNFLLLLFTITLFPNTIYALENFDLFFEWAEFQHLDPTYVNGQINISKVTRTTKGLYVTFNILKDFPSETNIVIEMYGYFSNEYRKVPLHIVRNMCGFFNNEFQWFKEQMLDAPNKFPKGCPLQKGYYYLWGFVPKPTGIPVTANMPWSKIKVTFEFEIGKLKIVKGQIFMYLDHDARLKKFG